MNKFKNIPVNWNGMGFRSKAERMHAMWLNSEQEAGKIIGWAYEKQYDLFAWTSQLGKNEKVFIGKIIPDFTVDMKNGCTEVHEVKGGDATKTAIWSMKKKIFEANYPWILYRVFDRWRY